MAARAHRTPHRARRASQSHRRGRPCGVPSPANAGDGSLARATTYMVRPAFATVRGCAEWRCRLHKYIRPFVGRRPAPWPRWIPHARSASSPEVASSTYTIGMRDGPRPSNQACGAPGSGRDRRSPAEHPGCIRPAASSCRRCPSTTSRITTARSVPERSEAPLRRHLHSLKATEKGTLRIWANGCEPLRTLAGQPSKPYSLLLRQLWSLSYSHLDENEHLHPGRDIRGCGTDLRECPGCRGANSTLRQSRSS